MARVAVIGGGLAGLATAAALGSAGFEVDIYESRGFLGGRATSWPVAGSGPDSTLNTAEMIDNCQHVLMRCCVNLLDLYGRLGATNKIQFYREFRFIEPGGRTSLMKRGMLPAPAHFAGSFLKLKFLSVADKIGIARAMNAIPRERGTRTDLDRITMLDWLREKRQTPAAIERYWRQVLVSAINEELDRMAAAHGFQVFWLGMIARADAYEMGIPNVPLRDLYNEESLKGAGAIQIHPRSAITAINRSGGLVQSIGTAGAEHTADFYVSALPFERLQPLMPELAVEWSAFEHSPITGIHLWFNRPVTDLPHATLLDRTIQWMFNKKEGRHIQVVVSASRSLVEMPREAVIEMAVRELAEFFPAVSGARLQKAQVIKELRATFSARPGLEALRPGARTAFENFFLAGDWTRSGWPATMEGAVRSGYLAAEAVTRAAGRPQSFLLADIA
ncbi:MAG TPA: hydroxysqualene dehydroxylase HpnE [Bryobacteraceae bacterium]|jgi:zeta-carotene desaturase|nr:hydroxysqualene dehydroxylase HpnE [Bryobacteraceae bacterium]